jgi:hypothetical protein
MRLGRGFGTGSRSASWVILRTFAEHFSGHGGMLGDRGGFGRWPQLQPYEAVPGNGRPASPPETVESCRGLDGLRSACWRPAHVIEMISATWRGGVAALKAEHAEPRTARAGSPGLAIRSVVRSGRDSRKPRLAIAAGVLASLAFGAPASALARPGASAKRS